jgi:hypothetical protein
MAVKRDQMSALERSSRMHRVTALGRSLRSPGQHYSVPERIPRIDGSTIAGQERLPIHPAGIAKSKRQIFLSSSSDGLKDSDTEIGPVFI